MVRRDPAEVQARRALGRLLRAARIGAGLTQKTLAKLVPCDASTVGYVENAHLPGSEHFWQQVDDALSAQGKLLRGFQSLEDARRAREIQQAQAAITTATCRLVDVTGEAAGPVALRARLADSFRMAGEYLMAWSSRPDVAEMGADALRAELAWVTEVHQHVPELLLLEHARAICARAAHLASLPWAEDARRELWALLGWARTTRAWLHTNQSQFDEADEQARLAFTYAQRANDGPLRAWVRATQQTNAHWRGDIDAAARFAEDGLRGAGHDSVALYLHGALAVNLARLGRRDRARTVLDRARKLAESTLVAGMFGGPFHCALDRFEGLRATALLALGEPNDAHAIAARALRTLEALPVDQRNHGSARMVRATVALTQVELGDLAVAEETLAPIFETPAAVRTRPLFTRIGDIAGALPATSDRRSRRLRSDIDVFQKDSRLTGPS